jgi:transposase
MLKVKLKPTKEQKIIFNEWFDTTLYVYNKALECIRKGHNPSDKQGLRNILVTNETRLKNEEYPALKRNLKNLEGEKKELDKENKNTDNIQQRISLIKKQIKELPIQKNPIQEWELNTPKEIRASVIDELVIAHKSAFTNLKNGNIKYFNIDYRKKDLNRRCCSLPKNFVKNINGRIRIAPTFFNGNCFFDMGRKTKRKHKDLEIEHDCKILKDNNEYWLLIPIPLQIQTKKKAENYCGIDAGIRTFMTTFGNKGCFEYEHNQKLLKDIDSKIKEKLERKIGIRRRLRKSILRRLEKRKSNLVDELHWNTIRKLLKENDVLFYGDFKSHEIVKNGNNKTLNRDLNNLKMYKFKTRLLFKTKELNKLTFVVSEAFTTKTCSFCGEINDPKSSKEYYCKYCDKTIGRDVNASKNILMRGIRTFL